MLERAQGIDEESTWLPVHCSSFLPLDLLNEFVDLGAIKALYKQDLSQHKNA